MYMKKRRRMLVHFLFVKKETPTSYIKNRVEISLCIITPLVCQGTSSTDRQMALPKCSIKENSTKPSHLFLCSHLISSVLLNLQRTTYRMDHSAVYKYTKQMMLPNQQETFLQCKFLNKFNRTLRTNKNISISTLSFISFYILPIQFS